MYRMQLTFTLLLFLCTHKITLQLPLADSKCSNCSSTPDQRVVGGTEAPSVTAYPSVVHIPDANCGATILNELYLITSAQCKIETGVEIIAGNPFKASDAKTEQKRKVLRKIDHEKHNVKGEWENDIALVRLDSPLTFTSAVQPTKLLPSNFFPSDFSTNYMATIVGWGSVSPTDPHAYSTRLRQIDIPYVNVTTCKKRLPVPKHDTVDCFGFTESNPKWEGEGTCDGDEGGPLYGTERGEPPSTVAPKFHRLIGIVSLNYCWKSIGNSKGVPGVFTSVRLYNGWMDRTLKADGYTKGLKGSVVEVLAPAAAAISGGSKGTVLMGIAVSLLAAKTFNFKLY